MTRDREQKIESREHCLHNSEENYFIVYNYTHKQIFKYKDGMKIFSSQQTCINTLSGSSWKVYFRRTKKQKGNRGRGEHGIQEIDDVALESSQGKSKDDLLRTKDRKQPI